MRITSLSSVLLAPCDCHHLISSSWSSPVPSFGPWVMIDQPKPVLARVLFQEKITPDLKKVKLLCDVGPLSFPIPYAMSCLLFNLDFDFIFRIVRQGWKRLNLILENKKEIKRLFKLVTLKNTFFVSGLKPLTFFSIYHISWVLIFKNGTSQGHS